MLTQDRHTPIAERLHGRGSVVASALAAELAVSEDTIRRDLRALVASGLSDLSTPLEISPLSGSQDSPLWRGG